MLDRRKVLNWWTGRLTDQEFADYSGMAPRAVGYVFEQPFFAGLVQGRGRGSRHIRRVDRKARNAIAIIQAMTETGMTFPLAANIINATPYLASTVTQVVDFSPVGSGVCSLTMVDPTGGWLPTDIVPDHIWGHHVLQCRDVRNPNPSPGDIFNSPVGMFEPNTSNGTMIVDRSNYGLPDIEVVPLTGEPFYVGEFDPVGLYDRANSSPESLPQYDDHLVIANGRWVFHRQPDPPPDERIQERYGALADGRPISQFRSKDLQFDDDPIAVIEPDKKTVRAIGWGRDEKEQARGRYYLKNFDSLLDVNMTLAVRKMKRRAYGLPVNDGRPNA